MGSVKTVQIPQLTLAEIASWQVPVHSVHPGIVAELPALQRGAVWKPRQVENLWDSLIRGFPIGSLLISPLGDRKHGSQQMAFAQEDDDQTRTHYLLDGQQRANAIALGFIDPLEHPNRGSYLWLDLSPPEIKSDEREFVFRVINRFHPWGFDRNNPERRMPVGRIRDAFTKLQAIAKELGEDTPGKKLPSEFPLHLSWPWDAKAPVPVSFIWKSKSEADVLAQLERLPYWHSGQVLEWRSAVLDAISGRDETGKQRLRYAVQRFKQLESLHIPILTVPIDSVIPDHVSETSAEQPDHIETLFVRVNSSGTALEGEELIYSLFKSEWPESIRMMDDLSHKLASPAKTVVLAARLVLARLCHKSNRVGKLPPDLNVSSFRRLLRGSDKEHPGFRAALDNALHGESSSGLRVLFERIHTMLCLDPQAITPDRSDFRLHPFLAADLARGQGGQNLMLLLLRWVDRMLETGIDPMTIDEIHRRRTLGFITAVSWLGVDITKCVNRLWSELDQCEVDELASYFNSQRFRLLLKRSMQEGVVLIPPIPDDVFCRSLKSLRELINIELADEKSEYWSRQDYYRNGHSEILAEWLQRVIYPLWWAGQHENVEAWWLDRILDNRKFVVYAQRKWLSSWFPDYDPTLRGAEDTNRPWDYDHIHPEKHVASRRRLPQFLRTLHWSNGNFRAWPLEANRSAQDSAPRDKLSAASALEQRYGLTGDNLADASFINEGDELNCWRESVPKDLPPKENYLAEYRVYRDSQMALIDAIIMRLGRIYQEWFSSLAISDLLPEGQPSQAKV